MNESATVIDIARLKRPSRKISAAVGASQIVVGKDILELLSTSMYVDPMTIYREYVQNAADSIDAARADGLLSEKAEGRVEIRVDAGYPVFPLVRGSACSC